jgi:hypothetical protein
MPFFLLKSLVYKKEKLIRKAFGDRRQLLVLPFIPPCDDSFKNGFQRNAALKWGLA